jgi:small subunit ribosomal protein S8
MIVNDPIADMLTRIRNALMAHHDFVLIPESKMKLSIARILKEEGFITDYEVLKGKPYRTIKVLFRHLDKKQPAIHGLKRVSKPGLKVYVQKSEIPRIYGGLGTAILSTSRGIVTGQKAHHLKTGGELLCYVW